MKNTSATPMPSEEISSAVIEMYSSHFRNLAPMQFAIVPKISTPTASRLVSFCVSEFSPTAGPRNPAPASATVASAIVSPQL